MNDVMLPRHISVKRGESFPSIGSHPEHFLPLTHHRRLQDPLEGKPNPNVLPHSIEAGKNSYYIGDIYDPLGQRKPWEIKTDDKPYLKYLKDISKGWPHLSYLASWMEVTTSPVKWRHLPSTNREIRAERTRVAVIDFPKDGNGKPARSSVNSIRELRDLFDGAGFNHNPDHPRLFVLEDLSRDVIEVFGSRYDVDPLFWRGHISDYLWFNTKDPWVELEDLPHIRRSRNFFNFRYVHPRYFRTRESHSQATVEAGLMNVLRRLDVDRISVYMLDSEDAVVGMCRSKASIWIRPNEDQKHPLGILIVDPTFKEGYPLWGGYRSFDPTPSFKSDYLHPPRKDSLFENVIRWSMEMAMRQFDDLDKQPKILAVAMLSIIAAEWLTVKEYVTTRLTQIEWELEIPDFRGQGPSYGLEASLKRLHPFRRSLPFYRNWVMSILQGFLNNHSLSVDDPRDQALRDLRDDFLAIIEELDILQTHVQNMISVVTAIISLEETKRSAEQNKSITRLTFLAVIFVPMSFVSSFFSMTPNVTSLYQTFSIYFVVAIPLTLFALSVAQWVSIKEWIRGIQQRWTQH